MYCCPDCFTHDFIKDFIQRNNEGRIGKCSFCTSSEVPLINPGLLSDYFQPIIDLYDVDSTGKSLIDNMQADWFIFEKELDDTKKTQLISEIADDAGLTSFLFKSTRHGPGSSFLNSWGEFRKELQHENRFFPKKAIDTEQIKELIDYLKLEEEKNPEIIYRSRINRDNREYTIQEMGKPPNDKAPDGRANPKGISYFYGASDWKTSIAETRPYKSEVISIGEFKLVKAVKLVDLRNPMRSISPFQLEDDGLVLLHKDHMPFLNYLSESLSIPVLPYKNELEYLPTQYLCELIKDKGFDGIIFKSSLGEGDNYVFFDDGVLRGERVDCYRTDDIVFKSVKL